MSASSWPYRLQASLSGFRGYSQTGIVSPEGQKSVLDMLQTLDAEMKDAKVDLARTFEDRFVKASPVAKTQ